MSEELDLAPDISTPEDIDPETGLPMEIVARMKEQAAKYDIFISYTGSDRQVVSEVVAAIEQRGLSFYDYQDIRCRGSIPEWNDNPTFATYFPAVVVFVSPNSMNNPNVRGEVYEALKKDVLVVPVLVNGGEPDKGRVGKYLDQRQIVGIMLDRVGLDEAIEELVRRVTTSQQYENHHRGNQPDDCEGAARGEISGGVVQPLQPHGNQAPKGLHCVHSSSSQGKCVSLNRNAPGYSKRVARIKTRFGLPTHGRWKLNSKQYEEFKTLL